MFRQLGTVLLIALLASFGIALPLCGQGTVLGSYAVLNEGVAQGNSMIIDSGQSFNGNGLSLYWQFGQAGINVVSMGSSRYELVENTGGRCVTLNGAAVTISSCTGSASQLFALSVQTDGSYTIASGAGTCLEADGAFYPVNALACTAALTQRWNFSGTPPLSLGAPPVAYTLTVNGGSGGGSYAAGTVVTVTANAAVSGYQFAGWTGMTGALANASAATTTLTMPAAAAAITATYAPISKYALTVNSGAGSGSYAAGAVVTVVANAAAAGYQFAGWTGATAALANASAATTTLTMPAAAAAITATYAPISTYALTVNSGSGSGSYVAGAVVTVTATPAASGYQFSGWTGATSGLANVSAATTTLTMPASATAITATYTPSTGGIPPGTVLGPYAVLNEGVTGGNSMIINYGQSYEGNGLSTYWPLGLYGFNVVSLGNSLYKIVETTSGRCVTISGNNVTIATCSGASTQAFTMTQQPDGAYTVMSASGTCMEADGAFYPVVGLSCNSSLYQTWKFLGTSLMSLGGPTVTVTPSPTVPTGYHLTFDDEFTSLSIADGNGAGTNWYSKTVECCLNDTSNPSTPTYSAGVGAPAGQDPFLLVPGGGLDIRLQKTNGAWYSGILATVDSNGRGFAQQYGYFEMKATFPSGSGTWPSFWLLSTTAVTGQASYGEIDVAESYMFAPTYVNTVLHDWTPPGTQVGYQLSQVADLSRGSHIFGMLWTATTMTFYCDGVVIYTTPTPAIMNQPYFPIIDLGLGGGFPTNQTPAQNDMIVQYVRVYSP